MNILFISKLSGNLWAGPNNSVPAQIRAQSKLDNCFWYNLNRVKRDEWTQDGLCCYNLSDYPAARLDSLPAPFNRPDLAVVEEVYCFSFERIINDLIKAGVPYIIIPRSTLTQKAQRSKRMKKRLGNLLWFNRMVRHAAAIQYLTEEERIESCEQWKVDSFVIPNGAETAAERKTAFSKNGLKAVYIGRVEIYQKGLDMLLQVVSKMVHELRAAGFILSLFGPDRDGAYDVLKAEISKHHIEDIVSLCGPVFGEEKRRALLDADLFVMTSRFEGLPMGMIEALAHGLPCIATTGTNLADEIRKYDAGWTAENSADSIEEALRKMLADRGRLAEKSANAITLSEHYTWDSIAARSHELYEKMISAN